MSQEKETTAAYFRRIILEKPELLFEPDRQPFFRRWEKDHPGQELTNSIRQQFSVERGKIREQFQEKEGPAPEPPKKESKPRATEAAPQVPSSSTLDLEMQIDDCLVFARKLGLDDIAMGLREIRNKLVVKSL